LETIGGKSGAFLVKTERLMFPLKSTKRARDGRKRRLLKTTLVLGTERGNPTQKKKAQLPSEGGEHQRRQRKILSLKNDRSGDSVEGKTGRRLEIIICKGQRKGAKEKRKRKKGIGATLTRVFAKERGGWSRLPTKTWGGAFNS